MSVFGNLNRVQLLGRIGKDPEFKESKSGVSVCSFSVATSENIKKGDNWEEQTEWHNIVCFGKLSEIAGKYINKGDLVLIEGSIKTDIYRSKDGIEKKATKIIANKLQLLSGNKTGDNHDENDQQIGRDIW